MVQIVAAVICAVALAGCARAPEIVRVPFEVKVPIAVTPTVPPSLLAPVLLVVPWWLDAGDPAISSGLDAEGERRLKALIATLTSRINAWEAWAANGGD